MKREELDKANSIIDEIDKLKRVISAINATSNVIISNNSGSTITSSIMFHTDIESHKEVFNEIHQILLNRLNKLNEEFEKM